MNGTGTSASRRKAKRAKRSVETSQFDAFTVRILRAYGRRVAVGDVEALSTLVALSAEVDAVVRLAVTGLRQAPYRYSWQEIADRLGTSRQAAQMRFGDRTKRGGLDRRLVEAGLYVTVATLVDVFTEHWPGIPVASVCPGCGYRYPDGVTDCPTNAIVRPFLYRRRGGDPAAIKRLPSDLYVDLHDRKTARTNRTAAARATRTTPSTKDTSPSLFDIIGGAA